MSSSTSRLEREERRGEEREREREGGKGGEKRGEKERMEKMEKWKGTNTDDRA